MCENNSRIWLLRANLLSISKWLKPAKFWNLEPVKIWNSEPAKIWNLEIAKFWKQESAKFGGIDEDLIRKPEQAMIFVKKKFGNQEGAKSKTSSQKSGFEVLTSGKLVNIWN
jgi:hypothetical protein